MLCLAQEPDTRLRELAAALDLTERTVFAVLSDLVDDGYVVKEKEGRRNRYRIQPHLPLRDAVAGERSIGEVLALFAEGPQHRRHRSRSGETTDSSG